MHKAFNEFTWHNKVEGFLIPCTLVAHTIQAYILVGTTYKLIKQISIALFTPACITQVGKVGIMRANY